jgi:biopolymer transport protein ExbB
MNVKQLIVTCASAVVLAIPMLAGPAHAQSVATPADVPAPGAAAALPLMPDARPPGAVGAVGAEANQAVESTENPYGLESLWKASDAVARMVLLLLLIMSAGSWYILIVKVLEQSKMMRQARAAAKDFWSAGTVAQGAAALEADSPYRYMAEAAGRAVTKHEGLRGHVDLNDWIASGIQRAVDRIQSNTQGGLAFLATVGSIAPFVGLFGTVWGIYHALTAIGVSGQASIDKVAGPVGEALLMTAIGLAVAVPAVLAYNWLVRRNKAVMDDVRAFSGELHAVVLGSVNKA